MGWKQHHLSEQDFAQSRLAVDDLQLSQGCTVIQAKQRPTNRSIQVADLVVGCQEDEKGKAANG